MMEYLEARAGRDDDEDWDVLQSCKSSVEEKESQYARSGNSLTLCDRDLA